MALEAKDALLVLWNQYKDEQDWQRHSETQRATFAQLLFVFSGALLALNQSVAQVNGNLIPNLLICIGVFGALMVLKYRERYLSHVAYAREYRVAIDRLLAEIVGEHLEKNPLTTSYERGELRHSDTRLAKLLFYRQYALWVVAFIAIAVAGFFLRR